MHTVDEVTNEEGRFLVDIRVNGQCREGVLKLHDSPGVCLGDGQTETYLKDMGMTGLGDGQKEAYQKIWA